MRVSGGAALVVAVLFLGSFAVGLVVLSSPTAEQGRAVGYQIRTAADTQAAEARAAIREAEREAGHQRSLEVLPYVVAVVGAVVLLGGMGAVVILALERGRPDPVLLAYLERQRLEQAELWRAVAQLDRRASLPSGDSGREVVIYTDRRQ